jgi:lyso-ornithine lipid O-acyltransferase
MRQLRASFIVFGFLGLTLPLMLVQFILVSFRLRAAKLLPYYYHRVLCRLLGVTVTIEGMKPIAPALLVSNHVSWIDIPILSSVLPLSFIAKHEVGGWPFFGWMAKLQRCVFVNRDKRHSTGKSASEIAERLHAGDSLVLFPEGTSNDGHCVLPFKSSYFGAAENLDVAVIPVTLAYISNYDLPLTKRQRPSFAWYGDMVLVPHLWAALKAGPIEVAVHFHEALPKVSRKEMAKLAHDTITKSLVETLHGRALIG